MESEVRSNGNRCQLAEMTEMNVYNKVFSISITMNWYNIAVVGDFVSSSDGSRHVLMAENELELQRKRILLAWLTEHRQPYLLM